MHGIMWDTQYHMHSLMSDTRYHMHCLMSDTWYHMHGRNLMSDTHYHMHGLMSETLYHMHVIMSDTRCNVYGLISDNLSWNTQYHMYLYCLYLSRIDQNINSCTCHSSSLSSFSPSESTSACFVWGLLQFSCAAYLQKDVQDTLAVIPRASIFSTATTCNHFH